MTKRIKQHLMENPSYFKWGVLKLANKFDCSERTMRTILNGLTGVKKAYLENLKG